MIRPQTVLVLLLVLIVIQWGADLVVSEDATDPVATIPAATTIASLTDRAATPAPSAEPTVIPGPTPTPEPLPTVEPTASPTEVPVATERPSAPDTGLDRSLIVDRGGSGRLEVAFTFDAGEGTGFTAEILDLLTEYGVVGTFGVTGQWAEQNPELMRRIVDEGHQILNHTYDHASFTGFSPETEPLTEVERREQVEVTEQIIADVTAGYQSSPYFRFPYGDRDDAALELLGEMGFSYTMWWSCDTLGWMGEPPDAIVERCGSGAEQGGPGAILLMHVAEENDWNALEPLIDDYLDGGYDFVTLEELVQP